jgi:hypothetical protein
MAVSAGSALSSSKIILRINDYIIFMLLINVKFNILTKTYSDVLLVGLIPSKLAKNLKLPHYLQERIQGMRESIRH